MAPRDSLKKQSTKVNVKGHTCSLLPGQLTEKLAECEDVLGDVMMDIRPKLSNVIV